MSGQNEHCLICVRQRRPSLRIGILAIEFMGSDDISSCLMNYYYVSSSSHRYFVACVANCLLRLDSSQLYRLGEALQRFQFDVCYEQDFLWVEQQAPYDVRMENLANRP